jgi:hypothetical protein
MLDKDTFKLKEELRELFRERQTKPELLLALTARLRNFQQLKGTLFQNTINEFITVRAEDDCEILIYDDEIEKLWVAR